LNYLCRFSNITAQSFSDGLDGPGIESRLRDIFLSHPDRSWGSTSLLENVYRVSFLGGKRPGCGLDSPTIQR